MKQSVFAIGGSSTLGRVGVPRASVVLGLCALMAMLSLSIFVAPQHAFGVGPSAVRYPGGWNTTQVAGGDDSYLQTITLPFALKWNGVTYTKVYLNMNGNITFGSAFTQWSTAPLSTVRQGIMAPFWADVDTDYNGSPNKMFYSNVTSGSVPLVNGHKAVLVTWSNVMRYNGAPQTQDTTNTFQVVLIDRSDVATGDFDFEFNYDKIVWDHGTAGSTYARAGWSSNGTTQTYELPGSGTQWSLCDSATVATSLIKNSLNSGGQLGRYVWQVRSGTPNSRPVITVVNRVLEGNVLNAYRAYNATASGDATATDPDGTIASFTSTPSLPATLPLGTTNILWTAVDNRSAITTAMQSVTVTDTTPPSLPTLSSGTHAAGVWSAVTTATVNWTTATDTCTGLSGYSYSWSNNATSMPPATMNATASATSTTTVLSSGVWYFNVRTVDKASNWSTRCVSYGPINIDTYPPNTTSNAPASWVSVNPTISLVATDVSGGPVAYTRYKLDAAAVATYTAPFVISTDGTHTLLFWSVDAAGNVEPTNTATVRIDKTPPSTPTSVGAAAVATTSVEVSWAPSVDSTSGIAYYAIYRNGSLAGTTTAIVYIDTGLNPGQSYSYYVIAYNGSGLPSAQSATVGASTPPAEIWISMTTDTVNMGNANPGQASTVTSATTIKVGGVGNFAYDFWCSAADFSNANTSSPTPTMPASTLSYATSGWLSAGPQPLSNVPYKLDTSNGSKYVWEHDYRFDYVLTAPWANDPGTYNTTVLYTVVTH